MVVLFSCSCCPRATNKKKFVFSYFNIELIFVLDKIGNCKILKFKILQELLIVESSLKQFKKKTTNKSESIKTEYESQETFLKEVL